MRNPSTLTKEERAALRALRSYTAGRFDIYMLAGGSRASCRAHVMSELNGIRTPQSKSGVTEMYRRFFEVAGVSADCHAIREDVFIEWCKSLPGCEDCGTGHPDVLVEVAA